MASGYGNTANLGIPIAMQVLGTVSFLVEVLLLQVLIVGPVILATLDRCGTLSSSARRSGSRPPLRASRRPPSCRPR
jgi:malonate transporter and related proteins